MTKHPFNMIEIALALAIMAIGMASVMVLFPAGLRAGSSARAEDYLSDVVEVISGKIQAELTDSATNAGWGSQSYAGKNTLTLDDTWPDGALVEHGTDKGTFLLRQYRKDADGNDYIDFSAIIAVTSPATAPQVLFPDVTASVNFGSFKSIDSTNSTSPCDLAKFYKIYNVEISWPADAPYAQREKKFYQLEFFNDKYDKSLDYTP